MSERLTPTQQAAYGNFERSRLDVADFDGTMYATFEEAPALGIYGVDEAYRVSIEKTLFFDKDALKRYVDQGEHQNRTPLEIVDSLVTNCTPQGLVRLTAALVQAKLDILEGQIGKPLSDGAYWPRPLPGFVEYSHAVTAAKTNGDLIHRAILSAGHSSFIRKCLEMSGIEQPEIMITDETIRGLNSTLPPHKLAKPSLMPLLLAKLQWLSLYGLEGAVDMNTQSINQRIWIIGDSAEKDGDLAQNAGAQFVYITPERAAEAWKTMQSRGKLATLAASKTKL